MASDHQLNHVVKQLALHPSNHKCLQLSTDPPPNQHESMNTPSIKKDIIDPSINLRHLPNIPAQRYQSLRLY